MWEHKKILEAFAVEKEQFVIKKLMQVFVMSYEGEVREEVFYRVTNFVFFTFVPLASCVCTQKRYS